MAQAIADGMGKEKEKLLKQLREEAQQEHAEAIKVLQEELTAKSGQVKELNKAKAEVERIRRQKDELKDVLQLQFEKQTSDLLAAKTVKIRKEEQDRVQLTVAERDKVIQQLKDQLQEAQRQAEQGSMQLQGEVQELAIQDWLRQQFPLDTIEEIRKGELGADCLQTVYTRHHGNGGTIYYESKRTKHFQPAWLEKFRQDIRERNATIGVLVTQSMPSDMEHMGLRDGVWICSFDEFRGLALVLRESLVRLSQTVTAQENRGEKMALLYDYLTGNEFRLQVEAIVEGFSRMQLDLHRERSAMQRIWKQREKQIEKVMLSTAAMHGAIRGIAGSAVRALPSLELPAAEEELPDPDEGEARSALLRAR
ncbi:MAG: DUF2130 domain-containing protein [Cyanobium sp. CZS 25K]|nr:DUF2130 domain-containing protein [Cyanobium sp. CZS25K]